MWRRLLVDSLAAGILAVLAGFCAIAWWQPLLEAACAFAGVEALTLTSSSDVAAFTFRLALACALVPTVAWLVCLVGRLVEGTAPGALFVAVVLTGTLLGFGAGLAARLSAIRSVLGASRTELEVAPTVTLGELGLAQAGAEACLGAGLLMAAVIWLRARRREDPERRTGSDVP